MNKNQQKKYDQAAAKGKQFFNKKNYQLAKRHFDTMLRLNSSLRDDKIFSEQMALCKQQEALRLRKETIKKGRNYEHKDKLLLAMECFENAFAVEQEDWLQIKIKQLKEKTAQAQAEQLVSKAENSNDPDTQLQYCKKALEVDAENSAVQKQMAQCYVKLQRYNDALILFQTIIEKNTLNSVDAYYFGYAYLQAGHLIAALLQWAAIDSTHPQAEIVYQQFNQLLPFAIKELRQNSADNNTIETLYAFVCLFEEKNNTDSQEKNELKSLMIKQLWKTGQYLKIHDLITPISPEITLAQLELYSKLYFNLACETEDLSFLEQAINFWLSAIYNEKLLYSLATVQNAGESLNIFSLQEKLLTKLETLIKTITVKKTLATEINILWTTQRDSVLLLSKLQNKSKTFKKNLKIEFYPCTPVFAKRFVQNYDIYELLLSNRRYLMGKHNKFSEDQYYECCCYFSPLADYMFSIIHHTEPQALKALSRIPRSKFDNKELFDYCQQKIAFEYAFRILSQKSNSKESVRIDKYFLQALPLIKKYPEYIEQLVEFALSKSNPLDRYTNIANIMENLSKHIKQKSFSQASAYAIAMKAMHMNHSRTSPKLIEKLLFKALELDPHSYFIQEGIKENQQQMYYEQFSHAIEKANISQAANIIIESGLDDLKENFFGGIEMMVMSVTMAAENKTEELMIINDIYIQCCRVDKNHPVTIELGEILES